MYTSPLPTNPPAMRNLPAPEFGRPPAPLMAVVEWESPREVNMKRSFIHLAIFYSLLLAMFLCALPLQAQSRDSCHRNRTSYRQAYYQQPAYVQPSNYRTHRSLGKSVLIVGGSAAAGAAIGGLAGGGK